MADYGHPFGATMAPPPPPPGPPPSAGGNPFDPLGSTASPPTPAAGTDPFGGGSNSLVNGYPNQQPPLPPQTPQPHQYQQQQYQQPFGGAPAPAYPQQQQPVDYSQNQMVVSSQQSNPYGGYAQTMIPATDPSQSQWGMGGAAPAPATTSTSFDPFAPPPPPAPAPVPPTPTPQPQQMAYPNPSEPFSTFQDPFGGNIGGGASYGASPQPPPPPAPVYTEPPAPAPAPEPAYQQQERQMSTYDHSNNYNNNNNNNQSYNNDNQNNSYRNYSHDNQDPLEEQQQQAYLNNYNDRQLVPATQASSSTAITVRSPDEVRNKYSQALSQQAGPMASPLPKAELVRKKGYVLSRISFRTIVMKKWKQSFWIQYGSHTMLWFRNEADFDDWLNNPYHTQAQRNFLIKLAVNFVHDLYKPNVRGYQVTQCRTKPYGTKVVRQFKLERWMDYGPTIAAAFGSYDPKEVDACREAIVECMKNTPLDNGIRATGAVKEYHEQQQAALEQQQQQQREQQGGGNGERYQNYQLPPGAAQRAHAQSLDGYKSAAPPSSSVVDLLDDTFDDAASVPPASAAGDLLGGALVPATNPYASYPGAPPPAVSYPPQQQYPGGYAQPQPPQQSYGIPPQQQQAPAYPAPAPAYPQQQQQYYGAPPPQQPPPSPQQAAAFDYGAYQQQPPQQSGGYPMASYPQPTQF
ncbi:hypothetical protein IV203_035524 [Nitzschia inconspicua]|uniref:Uncharacterized protein n=1 Tax=Nitzschia inconspicua TaxID=303405 RepID=A0A9K3LDG0_9STRA|nr:hypothetical protein IV203_035524 [Nitzschia inconspicua]